MNKDFLNKLNNIPEVEPDIEDMEALKRIANNTNDETITHEELRSEIEHDGIIYLRIPKSLHRELIQTAKDEGVSVNQYIMYKICH